MQPFYATMTYDLKWWGHGFLTFTKTAIRWVYGSRALFNKLEKVCAQKKMMHRRTRHQRIDDHLKKRSIGVKFILLHSISKLKAQLVDVKIYFFTNHNNPSLFLWVYFISNRIKWNKLERLRRLFQGNFPIFRFLRMCIAKQALKLSQKCFFVTFQFPKLQLT